MTVSSSVLEAGENSVRRTYCPSVTHGVVLELGALIARSIRAFSLIPRDNTSRGTPQRTMPLRPASLGLISNFMAGLRSDVLEVVWAWRNSVDPSEDTFMVVSQQSQGWERFSVDERAHTSDMIIWLSEGLRHGMYAQCPTLSGCTRNFGTTGSQRKFGRAAWRASPISTVVRACGRAR